MGDMDNRSENDGRGDRSDSDGGDKESGRRHGVTWVHSLQCDYKVC